jgi:hypothetical protein
MTFVMETHALSTSHAYMVRNVRARTFAHLSQTLTNVHTHARARTCTYTSHTYTHTAHTHTYTHIAHTRTHIHTQQLEPFRPQHLWREWNPYAPAENHFCQRPLPLWRRHHVPGMCVCVYVCISARVFVRVCMYICTCLSVCVCLSVSVCFVTEAAPCTS